MERENRIEGILTHFERQYQIRVSLDQDKLCFFICL